MRFSFATSSTMTLCLSAIALKRIAGLNDVFAPLNVEQSKSLFKLAPGKALSFCGHHVFRRNQSGRRLTPADIQIIAEGGMPSIGCGHHLPRSVALDFPRRIADRTRYIVTFVCDVLAVQLNCGRRSLHGAVNCRLVAV